MRSKVTSSFQERFGQPPAIIVRAPGRVNLIGEHTDYNDGFVLPMAINRAVWVALRPRADDLVQIYSLDFDQTREFSLTGFEHSRGEWVEYVKGTAWALQEAGLDLAGWEGVMAGDVPIGASLSSSAAVELATARTFSEVSGLKWNPKRMALLAQKAENQWVGVNCGIMDQMISAAGETGHALLIDCRSLDIQPVPLPSGTAVVVMDTTIRRGLVDSAYNERREQCEAAATFFEVKALRDVSLDHFEARSAGLDQLIRRRARHIITENERTLQAVEALRQGNADLMGRLMDGSHASLRDDFEVSCKELDLMVQLAQEQTGCYGARMTGGGFGGCAVALVTAERVVDFSTAVAQGYHQATGLEPNIYICQATNGAEIIV
jgi:galactokinase